MTTSEQVAELAAALAKAQAQIKAAAKDRTNPFFNSKYATLEAVWDACRGPLTANGLSIVQGAAATGGELVTVTTRLLHASGQWIESRLDLVPKDASPQAAGSALTYARRYGLAAMVGVAPEEDDDGNAAQPVQATNKPFIPRSAPKVTKPQGGGMEPITDEQADKEFPKYDVETEERKELVKEARRLADKIGLSPKDKQQAMQTYLGGKDVHAADLASLSDMVKWLRTRANE